MNLLLAITVPATLAAAPSVRSPFAVAETSPRSICIVAEQQLAPGDPVIVVLFEPERFIIGRVRSSSRESCGGDADLSGTSYALTPSRRVELGHEAGIAITSPTATATVEKTHVIVRGAGGRADVLRFRRCASTEGLHMTVWQGNTRVWHAYYYLGYDVEPTCTDEETKPIPPPTANTRGVRCAKSVPVPSEDSRVLSVSQAQSITTSLTAAEIYALLGAPARDNCSGLYCPEWDVADGRTLLVRFASGCERPLEVRLRGAMADQGAAGKRRKKIVVPPFRPPSSLRSE